MSIMVGSPISHSSQFCEDLSSDDSHSSCSFQSIQAELCDYCIETNRENWFSWVSYKMRFLCEEFLKDNIVTFSPLENIG